MKNREELIKIVGYLAEQKPEEWRMNGEGGPENGILATSQMQCIVHLAHLSLSLLQKKQPTYKNASSEGGKKNVDGTMKL
jgi:hypothetical protein